MRIVKQVGTGLVVAAALAFGAPSTASAGSINGFGFGFHRVVLGWSSHLSDQVRHRARRNFTHTNYDQGPRDNKDCPPDRAVPEPTAALLFGLGAAVVATRTRKRS